MGQVRSVYKWIFHLILCLAATDAAALEPLHWVGRYLFAWNGISLGSLELQIDETPDRYSMHLLVQSQGLVNFFTHHTSDTMATGRREADGYRPLHYESHYKTKNKPRHINLVFNARGVLTEETVEPPEDRAIRPEVPHALKDGSCDPLATLMELRAGHTDFHGFDARHLYEVKSVPAARATLRIAGMPRAATSMMLSRTPLAGMTAKESADYARGEPPLRLFFSDDAQRVPLAVSVPLFFGTVTGMLVRECKTWQQCASP